MRIAEILGVPGSGKTTLKNRLMAQTWTQRYECVALCPRRNRIMLKLRAYHMYPRLMHIARVLQAEGWVKHARCKEYLSWASTEFVRSSSGGRRFAVIDHGPTHVGIPFNFQPGGLNVRLRERFFSSLEGVRPDILIILRGGHESVVSRLRQRRKPGGKFDLMDENQLLHLFKQYEEVLGDVVKYYAASGVSVCEFDISQVDACSEDAVSAIMHRIVGSS